MMSVLDEAQRLARQGKMADAVALVRRAADAGDGEALFARANWALFGLHGNRDPEAARSLLHAAAAQGHLEASLLQATLLANGAIGGRDHAAALTSLQALAPASPDAAAQIELVRNMPDAADFGTGTGELLSERPHVRLVRGFLSQAECDYLIARSERHLRPSFITDPATRRPIPHPTRTSFGMSFGPTLEDLAVHHINLRVAAASGTDVRSGEPLHVLRYAVGQEYRPHLDTLPGVENQRTCTVLLYLNEDYQGGETVFEWLDLRIRGERGDALIFSTLDRDGRPDVSARHAGLPISGGTKWLATRWIRQAPVDPFAG
jgi:prolyl 4-hydroxylase